MDAVESALFGSLLVDTSSTTTPFSLEECCQDEWKEPIGALILAAIFIASTAVTLYGVKAAFRPTLPARLLEGPVRSWGNRSGGSGMRTSFSSWGTVATQSSVGAGASYTGPSYGGLRESSPFELDRLQSSEEGAEPELETSLWLYAPPEARPIDVRAGPGIDQPRTAQKLQPGEVFEVAEILDVPADDGLALRFLRLSSGAGWVFDRIPGHGVLCRPIPTIALRITPAKEHVGFKVHFPRPDTADDGGWPYVSAIRGCEGGLREDDRIVRVDGLRIRDKAATRMLLHLAMQRSRQRNGPITVEIFRPEDVEDEAGPAPRSFSGVSRVELAAGPPSISSPGGASFEPVSEPASSQQRTSLSLTLQGGSLAGLAEPLSRTSFSLEQGGEGGD